MTVIIASHDLPCCRGESSTTSREIKYIFVNLCSHSHMSIKTNHPPLAYRPVVLSDHHSISCRHRGMQWVAVGGPKASSVTFTSAIR